MNNDKTLGQIAFRAFYGHRKGEGAIPKWPAQIPTLCEDWEAAADAVVREFRTNAIHASAQAVLRNGEIAIAERAVIEAARAMLHALIVWGEGNHEFVQLRNAVRALEAAEKEQ